MDNKKYICSDNNYEILFIENISKIIHTENTNTLYNINIQVCKQFNDYTTSVNVNINQKIIIFN